MVLYAYPTDHDSGRDERQKRHTYIGKTVKRMNQFNLLYIFYYPGRNFISKIALTIKNNRLCCLLVDIAGDNAAINQV